MNQVCWSSDTSKTCRAGGTWELDFRNTDLNWHKLDHAFSFYLTLFNNNSQHHCHYNWCTQRLVNFIHEIPNNTDEPWLKMGKHHHVKCKLFLSDISQSRLWLAPGILLFFHGEKNSIHYSTHVNCLELHNTGWVYYCFTSLLSCDVGAHHVTQSSC